MLKPPANALVLADRAFACLCADIRDTKARGFPRVDALRHLVRVGREG